MSTLIAMWSCVWGAALLGIYACSRIPGAKPALLTGLALVVVLSFVTGYVMMFLPAVLVLLVMAAWPTARTHPAIPTLVCTVIVAGFATSAIFAGMRRLDDLREWRQEFAFRSIVPRLAYEAAHNSREQETSLDSARELSPDVAARLANFETRGHETTRTRMLRRLHDETRAEFEVLTGFGPGRMLQLHRRWLELPDSEPVPQPGPADRFSEFDPFWTGLQDGSTPEAPGQDALLALHDRGLEDFLNPERMGYFVDREHVAGFASHQFAELPQIDPYRRENEGAVWNVERLELIGLLSHGRPVAYVSEHLPNLAELGDAAVRDLDQFEQDALLQLQAEQDVVSAEFPGQIRLVGALRAGQSCLECHQVARGGLLGAFSYIIRPESAGTDEAPAIADAR